MGSVADADPEAVAHVRVGGRDRVLGDVEAARVDARVAKRLHEQTLGAADVEAGPARW